MVEHNRRSRVAVLTGASGSLGLAIACELGRGGCRLFLTSEPNDARRGHAVTELTRQGLTAAWDDVDLLDFDALAAYGETLLRTEPYVDVLVNCAGVLHRGDMENTSGADLMRSFGINCAAPFVLTRALAPALRNAAGAVLNVASITAVAATLDRVAYAVSKAGLVGLTRTLALELAPAVRVNAVLPGVFDTAMTAGLLEDAELLQSTLARIPAKRLGMPDDLATVAAFLVGDDSAYVTGTTLIVDGGVLARSPLPAGDPR